MSAQVHVVTDSTAGLSADEQDHYGITVVPLQVVIGGISYDEGAATSETVAEALKTYTPVSTSPPAPQGFVGADGAAVGAAARGRLWAVSAFFYADTVEHLRRGGGIGAAHALLGAALSVK